MARPEVCSIGINGELKVGDGTGWGEGRELYHNELGRTPEQEGGWMA